MKKGIMRTIFDNDDRVKFPALEIIKLTIFATAIPSSILFYLIGVSLGNEIAYAAIIVPVLLSTYFILSRNAKSTKSILIRLHFLFTSPKNSRLLLFLHEINESNFPVASWTNEEVESPKISPSTDKESEPPFSAQPNAKDANALYETNSATPPTSLTFIPTLPPSNILKELMVVLFIYLCDVIKKPESTRKEFANWLLSPNCPYSPSQTYTYEEIKLYIKLIENYPEYSPIRIEGEKIIAKTSVKPYI